MSRFSITIPDRYKQADFGDILDKLKNDYGMKVTDRGIEMRMFMREFNIEKFGKTFNVFVWAFNGHVDITISDQ